MSTAGSVRKAYRRDGRPCGLYGTKHVWLARVSGALGESPPQYVDRLYVPEESE